MSEDRGGAITMSLYKLFLLRCHKQLQGAIQQPKSGLLSDMQREATKRDESNRSIASQC